MSSLSADKSGFGICLSAHLHFESGEKEKLHRELIWKVYGVQALN
jgi:hypothetical protein